MESRFVCLLYWLLDIAEFYSMYLKERGRGMTGGGGDEGGGGGRGVGVEKVGCGQGRVGYHAGLLAGIT